MRHLKKEDEVIVLSGNHRGSKGKIVRFLGKRVIVEGVNLRKKHIKPGQGNPGRIIEREAPLDSSNIALCIEGKPVKLRVRQQDGNKQLVYKWDGQEVVYRTL